MRSRFVALVLLLLMVSATTPAFADAVRGVLWMNRGAARAGAADERGPVAARAIASQQRGVTEAVVWLEKVPEKLERKLVRGGRRWFWQKRKVAPLAVVAHRGRSFSPRVLVVTAGDSVVFRNRDRIYHNVFSVSAARRFDLGKHAPGRADTVVFTRPGVVNLHCDIHPEELGYLVVVPNHACARPDSAGAFALPALLPGRYVLRAWHPRRGELSRAFDVPKKGDVGLQLVF